MCCGFWNLESREGIARMFMRQMARAHAWLCVKLHGLEERGQGTTEYAILVGVLAVLAIVAITAFRGKLQELWTAISTGINGL